MIWLHFLSKNVDVFSLSWLNLLIPSWFVFVWQMKARRCVAHPLTCRAVAWVRWASSYGRYATRRLAPGTTYSLLSLVLSSLPLAPCQPGWWALLWCSTSAISRRKTSSLMTRKRPVIRVGPRGPGVTMGKGILKTHILFKGLILSCPPWIPIVPPVSFQDCLRSLLTHCHTESGSALKEKEEDSTEIRNVILLIVLFWVFRWCNTQSGCHARASRCSCMTLYMVNFCDSWKIRLSVKVVIVQATSRTCS